YLDNDLSQAKPAAASGEASRAAAAALTPAVAARLPDDAQPVTMDPPEEDVAVPREEEEDDDEAYDSGLGAPDDGVEMRFLVAPSPSASASSASGPPSSSGGRASRDAPEDDVPLAHSFRKHPRPGRVTGPAAAAPDSSGAAAGAGAGSRATTTSSPPMLSNEAILNGLSRASASIGGYLTSRSAAASAARSASDGPSPPAAPGGAGAPSSSPSPAESSEASSVKRKKMILLLMATLFVALAGVVLEKRTAVEAELEVEEGEVDPAFHEHSAPGDVVVGDEKSKGKEADDAPVRAIDVEGYQPQTMVPNSAYVMPGTERDPPLSASRGRPYYPILNHFQHRDPTSTYAKTWGCFDFEDPDPKWRGKMRPQPDFSKAPNRDVNNSDFPDGAWQTDEAYMTAFLKEARLLVKRTIEAVYGEYGVGIPPGKNDTLTQAQKEGRKQFFPWIVKRVPQQPSPSNAHSWTTQQSIDGMARRLVHHITTGDTFKLVLGGHSAAAGHGAGFNQSYIIEAGHVLEPVFAHLGVEFRAYNLAQGGVGTFQQSLAGMDLRGKEVSAAIVRYGHDRVGLADDGAAGDALEFLLPTGAHLGQPVSTCGVSGGAVGSKEAGGSGYEAVLQGLDCVRDDDGDRRAPILMGEAVNLEKFHDVAGAAVAHHSLGWVPVTVSEEQVKTVPWAAQYLQCARGATANCKGHEYTAGCWVPREDFKPSHGQASLVGGQASWHPGNRIHKRRGRMIALVVLKALDYALEMWQKLGSEAGFPVSQDWWHVTDYYNEIRRKAPKVPGCYANNWKIGQARRLEELDPADGEDEEEGNETNRRLQDDLGLGGYWPSRLCNLPLQGRTLWGPRYDPFATSLLTILKTNGAGEPEPTFSRNAYRTGPCYQPPDLPAPWTVPPNEAEPFAPLIGASRRLAVGEGHQHRLRGGISNSNRGHPPVTGSAYVDDGVEVLVSGERIVRNLAEDDGNDGIVPGYGIGAKWGRPGVCDGTSHHWCDKGCESGCFMGGAQDNRGMVCFDGFSGWVVFEIKNVRHGFIGARMEAWHKENENLVPATKSWNEVNNGGTGNYNLNPTQRRLQEEHEQKAMLEGLESMKREIEDDILHENDPPEQRRLGGGQSCGLAGNYVFEWAINNGTRHSWNMDQFCKHYTRLNYNLDVIKFMDNATKTGDFELAMRMTTGGKAKVMCVSHLYWS
ncbi:hypothetical protein ACHAWF_014985, partial [Thalassiosira exigua]